MKDVFVRQLLTETAVGTQVVLYGWVKSRRRHCHVVFLDVVDSTGMIQVVVDEEHADQGQYQTARSITPESSVKVIGNIVASDRQNNHQELRACKVEVINPATLEISPQPRSHLDIFSPEHQEQLLNKRHFYLRNEKNIAILKFRHELTRAAHHWFDVNDFMELHAPILTPTPLYDDRTPIGLQVHGQAVFLTQCVGFYLEQAVHAFEKIYNIGPSFRAEESRSKRHLMEYWHIKAEMAFIDFEGLAATVEQFIHDITLTCSAAGESFAKTIGSTYCMDGVNIPFPRIDYAEAIEWLQNHGSDITFGKSLGSDEEALLSEKFPHTPFWVVGIPRSIEPFPYVIDSIDPRRTKTADLIASGGFGELLGIAEKIHTLQMLDERLAEKGKAGDLRYEWLRELRQFGCVPHGGFGMGLERLIRWFLQIPHVRDTIPFHRAFGRRINP